MVTSACTTNMETRGEVSWNVATAGGPERGISAGHMRFTGCMAEIRWSISRVTWRRSVAELDLQRHHVQRLPMRRRVG